MLAARVTLCCSYALFEQFVRYDLRLTIHLLLRASNVCCVLTLASTVFRVLGLKLTLTPILKSFSHSKVFHGTFWKCFCVETLTIFSHQVNLDYQLMRLALMAP